MTPAVLTPAKLAEAALELVAEDPAEDPAEVAAWDEVLNQSVSSPPLENDSCWPRRDASRSSIGGGSISGGSISGDSTGGRSRICNTRSGCTTSCGWGSRGRSGASATREGNSLAEATRWSYPMREKISVGQEIIMYIHPGLTVKDALWATWPILSRKVRPRAVSIFCERKNLQQRVWALLACWFTSQLTEVPFCWPKSTRAWPVGSLPGRTLLRTQYTQVSQSTKGSPLLLSMVHRDSDQELRIYS